MTPDTITTEDGRTVPLDGLEQAANLQPRSANASWLSKHGLAPVIQFDRETCLALVAEVRRLRDELERAEMVVNGLANGMITAAMEGEHPHE